MGKIKMRLLIVSNCLPISIKRQPDNTFKYIRNSGGLVTGLVCLQSFNKFIWIGNIAGNYTEKEKEKIETDLWEQFNSVPVFVTETLNERAYNRYCNKILWPVLHYFADEIEYNLVDYEYYKWYNTKFSEKIIKLAQDGDRIWVHDYHMMLLPNLLRSGLKVDVRIGFFLHIPWPIVEVFQMLPKGEEIVEGIMGADSVGFHSYEYVLNFKETVKRIYSKRHENSEFTDNNKECICSTTNEECKNTECNCSTTNRNEFNIDKIILNNRKIKLSAIPIGIEPKLFRETLQKEETISRINELKSKFANKFVILSVDRIDYIKGIPNRLHGYKAYLEDILEEEKLSNEKDLNKKLEPTTAFLQVSVPSRETVKEYESLTELHNKLVNVINSKSRNIDNTYVYSLNKSVTFTELCALYAVADMCLITSLIDGMNLVALEYVSCQEERKGVLVLSKFAGASLTLPGALNVNSWNYDEIKKVIRGGINMKEEERLRRYEINKRGVEEFTARRWAEENIKMLEDK